MPPPLVSIIIPCWNGESYVGTAIDSALRQTYQNVEVVVVDDGSTDRTTDVLKSFGDRIRWESTSKRGACAARNRGVELSGGDYLQFLDADDILLPEKLSRTLDYAAHDGVLPICGWETVSADGACHVSLPNEIGSDGLAYALVNQIPTPTPLHRREWFQRVGGFLPGLPCGQERDLHIRLAAMGAGFTAINEPLVRVRRREGSVSSDAHRVLLQHEGTFLSALAILQKRDALTDDRRAAIARAFIRDARQLVRYGDRKAAARYAAHARSIHAKGGLDAFRRPSRTLAEIGGPVFAESAIQYAARALKGLGAQRRQ